MKPRAVTHRQSECPVVGGEIQDVASAVQNGRAYLAVFQVALDLETHFRVDGTVDVIGDIPPDMLAVQLHSALPKSPRRGEKELLSNGTSRFCNSIRARCSRTLTTFAVTPSALAVSSTFNSSRSRRVNTSR